MTLRTITFLAGLALAAPAAATDGGTTEAAVDPVAAWQENPEQVFDARDLDLSAFRWVARPIVVFADTSADPRFQEQMELLSARPGELVERDVIVITDTAPGETSALRKKLRPRGFMVALIGKDGGVKLRKPFPWDVREFSRSIDKMPMRQQELRSSSE